MLFQESNCVCDIHPKCSLSAYTYYPKPLICCLIGTSADGSPRVALTLEMHIPYYMLYHFAIRVKITFAGVVLFHIHLLYHLHGV